MPTKMISTTLGSISFDSGEIAPTEGDSPGAFVLFAPTAGAYGSTNNDAKFYNWSEVEGNLRGGAFVVHEEHDLRDLLTEGKCFSDVMVNVQRMAETPFNYLTYNVAPMSNIYEALVVTNTPLDWNTGALGTTSLFNLFGAGFRGLYGDVSENNRGKLDDHREIIYAERRVYAIDRSQEYYSPNEMGVMGGDSTDTTPTRWLNNFLLMDRTVSGEQQLIIGPTLQIYRFFFIGPANRDYQVISNTTPDVLPANEYLQRESRCFIEIPAITVNVIGNKRDLTATEKAVEYTNVYLSNQSP